MFITIIIIIITIIIIIIIIIIIFIIIIIKHTFPPIMVHHFLQLQTGVTGLIRV